MDISNQLQQQVRDANANREPVSIIGGNSKSFYGRKRKANPLLVGEHRGVVNYEPSELVLTARCGTRLSEIEAMLGEAGQMLPFEPPQFTGSATIGGTVASGLSGPGRVYWGAARDYVLGVQSVNGKGEVLRFGGEVVKNVAGFDASRLMVGAMGTLGVLLEISLKVLPKPDVDKTLRFQLSQQEAIRQLNQWSGKPLPVTASAYTDNQLYIRLSGTKSGVDAAIPSLGGGEIVDSHQFWSAIRDQTHPFFRNDDPLWRVSVPPATAELPVEGEWLIEWGGAQRWLKTSLEEGHVRDCVKKAGGYATRFRGHDSSETIFHPLPPALHSVHQHLKCAFDPCRVLNPGIMYADL
ncbi:MAG: glycolate oxidase subunit GlcE [Gammaproteobacteria bacterium]